MDIITLTLSPAYDVHVYAPSFLIGRENHVKTISNNCGGKGLNISRALGEYGIKNTAILLLGDENCEVFENTVLNKNIVPRVLKTNGRIRENITVHTDSGEETRISFDGFSADGSVISKLRESLLLRCGDILTVTGSIPPGIDIKEFLEYLSELKESGIKIVIDSRSLSLADIAKIKPLLIKPNAEEVSKYLNREIKEIKEAVFAASELSALGVENVIISLGELGAVLSAQGRTFIAKAPKIDTVSTIGAGDSMIAGFIAATKSGMDIEEALKYAVAFGSAACLSEGSLPPEKSNIQSLINKIEIHEEK